MPTKKVRSKKSTQPTTTKLSGDLEATRITRTIYFTVVALLGFIIVSDSSNLILREKIVWLVGGIALLFIVNTGVWMLAATAESTLLNKLIYRMFLIFSLVLLAGIFTYNERGMASTSTALYALPVLVAATLKNRHILMGTALLTITTYFYAAVAYFNLNFNEGYRVELYSKLLLFTGLQLSITWLVMTLVGLRRDSK